MSFDHMAVQGTGHTDLGLAWSVSAGTGANWPSEPDADHQGPWAEGGFCQRVSGTAWEALLQEAGP